MLSHKTLAKIAVFTGFFGTSSCVFMYMYTQKKLKNSPYIVESMRLLQSHNDAMDYLGKPIKYGYVNLDPERNFCDSYKAQFEIPVKGSKNSGKVYLWAKRENPEQNWDVYRLEFSPSIDTSKRLTVKQQEC